MISQDFKQRIKVGAIFLLQIYKVTTGTMLSLFVPQACSSDDYLDGSYNGLSDSDNGSRICTLQENYENADGVPIAQIHILNETEAETLYHPRWITFIQVGDVDATCTAAEAIEATIIRRPYEAPGLGRCAVLADSQGSVFGIIEPV